MNHYVVSILHVHLYIHVYTCVCATFTFIMCVYIYFSLCPADQVYGDQDMHSVVRNHTMDYMVRGREGVLGRKGGGWCVTEHFGTSLLSCVLGGVSGQYSDVEYPLTSHFVSVSS